MQEGVKEKMKVEEYSVMKQYTVNLLQEGVKEEMEVVDGAQE